MAHFKAESNAGAANANILTAQNLYGAFTRGDVATVLAGCTADVEWHAGGRREDFPTFGPRKGLQQVQEFFHTVAWLECFNEFSPKEFYTDGDHVFALGNLSITLISNGRQLSSEWVHVITFRNGNCAVPRVSRHGCLRRSVSRTGSAALRH